MIYYLICLALAMLPFGSPQAEEITFDPTYSPSKTMVRPEAVYLAQTINLAYANPESADITIYNSDGAVVATDKVAEYGEIEIDTTGWRAGYYTIYVESESAAYKGTFYVDWQREGS